MTDADRMIARVLEHEKGWVNHPDDPGGETNLGITWPTLHEAIRLGIVPAGTTIKSLTVPIAIAIYREMFWNPLGKLHAAAKFQMLDAAVNHGIGNANRFLQRAVDVADDGKVGPITRAAIDKFVDDRGINDLLLRFIAQRLRFMTKLSTFASFGRGWSNRIAENLLLAAEDN
jgi:lysozyme family protein